MICIVVNILLLTHCGIIFTENIFRDMFDPVLNAAECFRKSRPIKHFMDLLFFHIGSSATSLQVNHNLCDTTRDDMQDLQVFNVQPKKTDG